MVLFEKVVPPQVIFVAQEMKGIGRSALDKGKTHELLSSTCFNLVS